MLPVFVFCSGPLFQIEHLMILLRLFYDHNLLKICLEIFSKTFYDIHKSQLLRHKVSFKCSKRLSLGI